MRSLLALGLLLAAFAPACAHKSCQQRADEAYQSCLHPWTSVGNAESGMPDYGQSGRGDEAQACQASHMQSLASCGEPPPAPVVHLSPPDAGP